MRYLIDTDRVIDALIDRANARQLLTSLASEGLAISLITYGEIYEGIYFGRDPKAHEASFRNFLRQVDVLPLNRRILQRYARIRGELRRTGELIGDPDILIAATAIQHRLTLVTGNVRHFARIPKLQLYRTAA